MDKVADYLVTTDDEQTVKDSQVLIEMMRRISGRTHRAIG